MARADTLRTDNADFEDAADLIDALGSEATNEWLLVDEAWSYLGTATITIPSGGTTRFQKGDKIKIDNTTTKYFYVTSVTSTQLTVTGGTDYTVANVAITNIYVSRASHPFGFPGRFNYTTTVGSSAGTFTLGTTNFWYFSIEGCWVKIMYSFSGTLASASADYLTMTLPVAFPSAGASLSLPHRGADDGTYSAGAIMQYQNNSSTVRFYKTNDLGTTDYTTGTNLLEGVSQYVWF